MHAGTILKDLRPEGVSVAELARRINKRTGRDYDRTTIWKMENGHLNIPGEVLLAWLDEVGVPAAQRWDVLAVRLGITTQELLATLGLPSEAA